ncbi:hypothetical protein GTA09_02150 [Rhodococcus hoagii]|nr:hypothetical protein [Prescottella equi]
MTGLEKLKKSKRLIQSSFSDLRRYSGWSGIRRGQDPEVLAAAILKDFHRVEKGLTLPAPRAWFGKDVVERLVGTCQAYSLLPHFDERILGSAVAALTEYGSSFQDAPPVWWKQIEANLADLRLRFDTCNTEPGGSRELGELAHQRSPETGQAFSDFIRSRSSVRNFSERMVDDALLEAAVVDAQHSPSVCNRQSSRVRYFARGDAANRLLQLQNGNRGFGSTASHVALVTGDLRSFLTSGERNQVFIDGGLFSMNLVHGLLARGVGTCCLNWSVDAPQDAKLRRALNLPPHEVVIMMIALGYPEIAARVTHSPKIATDRVLMKASDGNALSWT